MPTMEVRYEAAVNTPRNREGESGGGPPGNLAVRPRGDQLPVPGEISWPSMRSFSWPLFAETASRGDCRGEDLDRDAKTLVHARHGQARGNLPATISLIWKAFGLKPWLEDTFKLSTDPLFIDKVRDVVGLHMSPLERVAVLCVDEKTQVQALDRTQPIFPLLYGTAERRSHDHVRHGTIGLYAALNLASGLVVHELTARHRAIQFKRFLHAIGEAVPVGLGDPPRVR